MHDKIFRVLAKIASCLKEGSTINLYFLDGSVKTINPASIDLNCFIRNLYYQDTLAYCYIDMYYERLHYTNKDIEDILF